MEETLIRFTGSTNNVGGGLAFSCKVEYSSGLDPFLPKDLKKQVDVDGANATVLPFGEGRGSFSASSLERAESLEAEITAKLKTAYLTLLERRERIKQWTGSREYHLNSSEENHEETIADPKESGCPELAS